MKNIILTVLALAITVTTTNAKIWTDEDGNEIYIPEEKVEQFQEAPVPAPVVEKKLNIEYIKSTGTWLKVGLKSTYKGNVICRALDSNGKTLAIDNTYVDAQYQEILIMDASHADSVSCSRKG